MDWLLTCHRGAGVLQQSIDELQALVSLCDGALQVELVHNEGLTSSFCQIEDTLHLHITHALSSLLDFQVTT